MCRNLVVNVIFHCFTFFIIYDLNKSPKLTVNYLSMFERILIFDSNICHNLVTSFFVVMMAQYDDDGEEISNDDGEGSPLLLKRAPSLWELPKLLWTPSHHFVIRALWRIFMPQAFFV